MRTLNHEMQDLVVHCSTKISSTIDRELVESERQFRPFLSEPMLVETMSDERFSSLNVLEYHREFFCLIVGTSKEEEKNLGNSSFSTLIWFFFLLQGDGRLMTIFINVTSGEKIIYEELTLPFNTSRTIQSINYEKMTNENDSFIIFVTHPIGYSIVKLIPCRTDRRFLCFSCWTKTCSIRQMNSIE